VPGLAGDGDDLHRALGDLGHLEREELAHQVGMGARQPDLGLPDAAGHPEHVATQPIAVVVLLAGNLFGRRDDALGELGLAAHPQHHLAQRVGAGVLLDDTGDDVALTRGELAVDLLVLGVAEPLQHDLARRGGRHPAESLGGVVPFADQVAVLVEFARHHLDLTGLGVDVDAASA
jgi:hypothetical protein